MSKIYNGRGNGSYAAGVNINGEVSVLANSIEMRHHTSHVSHKTFVISINQTPSAPNTPFFYLKNNDLLDLTLWNIYLRTASAESIDVKVDVQGTAVGTTITGINNYIGSNINCQCDAIAGNGITGLSGGSLWRRYTVPGDSLTRNFATHAGLIIPQTKAIAFYAVNGSINLDFSIVYDFHEKET